MDLWVFWIVAPISVASAIGMLLMRNAVHAALLLVLNLFTLAVFYVQLEAHFLAAVQVIVYAGAIMVLFLFVIMLIGVDRRESLRERLRGQRVFGVLLGLGIAALLFLAIRSGVGLGTRAPADFASRVNADGNVRAVSEKLFTDYFFPFEVTSVLLIVAAVAAMVLARGKARGLPDLDESEAGAPEPEPPPDPAPDEAPEPYTDPAPEPAEAR